VGRFLIIAQHFVGALGYFVDVYDLILFSIVRGASLKGLGVPADQILPKGVLLLNWQMGGMLIGGIFFGMLGDRFGARAVPGISSII
jgi:MFS family permease